MLLRGILDDNVPAGTTYKGVKVIGRIANLMIILPSSRLDEIAITLGLSEYYRLEEIVALCEKSGVHTKFIPDYNNIIPTIRINHSRTILITQKETRVRRE